MHYFPQISYLQIDFLRFLLNYPTGFWFTPLCKGLRKPRVAGCFRDLVANRAIGEVRNPENTWTSPPLGLILLKCRSTIGALNVRLFLDHKCLHRYEFRCCRLYEFNDVSIDKLQYDDTQDTPVIFIGLENLFRWNGVSMRCFVKVHPETFGKVSLF